MPEDRPDSVLFDVDLGPVPWFARTTRRLWCVGMGIAGAGFALELAGVPDAYGRSGAVLTAFAVYCTSIARHASAIAEHSRTVGLFNNLVQRIDNIIIDVRLLTAVSVHKPLGQTDRVEEDLRVRDRLIGDRELLQALGERAEIYVAHWSSASRILLELEGALLIGGALLWGFGDLDLPAPWRAAVLERLVG